MFNEAEIKKAVTSIIKAISENPEKDTDTIPQSAEPFLELPADLAAVEQALIWS